MDIFVCSGPAELYTVNRRRAGRQSVTYRKFETAAKAIRYSIEERPCACLPGTILEGNEETYHQKQIRKRYDSGSYPLQRRTREASDATQTQL